MEAADVSAALDAVHRDRLDLIVLDLNLPGMDGLDVCRALRRQSDVPIIMLTARSKRRTSPSGWSSAPPTPSPSPFRLASWWLGSAPCSLGSGAISPPLALSALETVGAWTAISRTG